MSETKTERIVLVLDYEIEYDSPRALTQGVDAALECGMDVSGAGPEGRYRTRRMKTRVASSASSVSGWECGGERMSTPSQGALGPRRGVVRNHTGIALGEHHQNARYSDATVRQARALHASGLGYQRIGQQLGIPWRTVADWIRFDTRWSA